MALPSETSDTRHQFTWSHCYDMSLTVTAPCHARGHSGHTGFPSVALEIKLQMEHCMAVIHRVRVNFNIPGRPTQRRLRVEKIPTTKFTISKPSEIMYMYIDIVNDR